MNSRLLTTMAIVRVMAEDDHDYISYIEPFAVDRLKVWPEGVPAAPEPLSRSLTEGFGFPSIPIHVSEVLIERAAAAGYLTTVENQLVVDASGLVTAISLAEKKSVMEATTASLATAVVEYAKQVHGLDWDEGRAYEALERLCEDFGADLALARREGLAEEAPRSGESLAIVYGFARRALERDAAKFDALVALVQGTMLANAIYFEDTRPTVNRLPNLRVYLDTRPLLRALGAAEPAVTEATLEMLELMRDFKIRTFVFPHVIDEMASVLSGVARSLKRGRSGFAEQGKIGGYNREAIDALVKQGVTAGEVEGMIAELPQRLARLRVMKQETPPHLEKGHIDEVEFDRILEEVVGYKSRQPKDTDLRSLAAIDRLRRRVRPHDLSHTPALFVTTNAPLIKAARRFFLEEGRVGVDHAMLDVALTSQLWVRSTHRKPELPRRMLIADCYAALSPSPELWERWVATIGRLRDQGDLSDDQVQTLVYHQQAKSALFESTRGNPEKVQEATVVEVLESVERTAREPIERIAEDARAEVLRMRAQQARLATEVAALRSWKMRAITLMHRAAGYGGAILATAVVVALALTGVIHGKLGWASASVAWVMVGAGAWAWGERRPIPKTMFRAVVLAGSATALWFAVWAVVPGSGDRSERPGKSRTTSTVAGPK